MVEILQQQSLKLRAGLSDLVEETECRGLRRPANQPADSKAPVNAPRRCPPSAEIARESWIAKAETTKKRGLAANRNSAR